MPDSQELQPQGAPPMPDSLASKLLEPSPMPDSGAAAVAACAPFSCRKFLGCWQRSKQGPLAGVPRGVCRPLPYRERVAVLE